MNFKKQEIQLHKSLVKSYVNERYATEYSKHYHEHWNKVLLSLLSNDDSNIKILDCGCGTGFLLKDLDKLYKSSYGLDISYDMLKKAQEDVHESNIIMGDAETLPFSEKSFDAVVCRGSLHHLPFPQKALYEIHKSLKKGGSLVLSEPCIDSIIIRLLRKILYKKSDRFRKGHSVFKLRDLENFLKISGFDIEKVKYFGFLAYPLCGFPDFIPLLNYVPFSNYITKFLISFDEFLSHVPIIKKHSWQVIILARE